MTFIFNNGCHFYFQVRLVTFSNIMFVCSGAVCIQLRGSIAPIMLALFFSQLEGMCDGLCSLLHGGREISNNLLAVQKLLKLRDIKQELLASP